MMGPKKLSTIRKELRRALSASGDDPIRWLEERMRAPVAETPAGAGTEVLQSLRRILAGSVGKRRRKSRVGSKK
jgi:hypothetical protein